MSRTPQSDSASPEARGVGEASEHVAIQLLEPGRARVRCLPPSTLRWNLESPTALRTVRGFIGPA
jgi:hypothetical protein